MQLSVANSDQHFAHAIQAEEQVSARLSVNDPPGVPDDAEEWLEDLWQEANRLRREASLWLGKAWDKSLYFIGQ